jgi:hypothetical protein
MYAVLIKPGEEILTGDGRKLRVASTPCRYQKIPEAFRQRPPGSSVVGAMTPDSWVGGVMRCRSQQRS